MTPATGALNGIRVLDLGHGVAGPFAARLLGDLGADVIKIERPGAGDFARRLDPLVADGADRDAQSLLFRYLNWNKRSISLDLNASGAADVMRRLVESADIVIDSFRPGRLDGWGVGYQQLREWNPAIVLTSISNFGQTSALADWQATDLVLYAMSGMMSVSGKKYPNHPLKHGLRQSLYCAGLNGAYASLAAYLGALHTGVGDHVDLAIREVLASTLTTATSYYVFMGAVAGRHPIRQDPLSGDPLDTANGFVSMQTGRPAPIDKYADFLDLPQINVTKYFDPDGRIADADMLRELFEERLRTETATEFFARANKSGLLVGLVQGANMLLDNEQLRAREFFRAEPARPGADGGTTWEYPFELFRHSRTPATIRTAAPGPGEHTVEILTQLGFGQQDIANLHEDATIGGHLEGNHAAGPIDRLPRTDHGLEWRTAGSRPGVATPLSGLRVVDLSGVIAGPYLGSILASLGARVIKIEGPQRPDTTRYAYGAFLDNDPGDNPWDRGGAYNFVNRGKQSLVCDLETEAGRDVLRSLLRDADVLVENFTPRVLLKWGFTTEVLHELNPKLIVLSNSGFGADGPWRDFRAQGTTLELTMGIAYLTGYEGGRPSKAGQSYPDFISGWSGLVAVLAALVERTRSGLGQRIDQAMYQVGAALIPEAILQFQVNGKEIERLGAQDLDGVLSGTFETVDRDTWVAISIRDCTDLARLSQYIPGLLSTAKPEPTANSESSANSEPSVTATAARAQVAAWVADQRADDVVVTLQSIGVPAGRVMDVRDLLQDPDLLARGFYEDVDLGSDAGIRPMTGVPFTFRIATASGTRVGPRAPRFGEHNELILREVLGMDDVTIADLYASGVVADAPTRQPPFEVADVPTMLSKGSMSSVDPDFIEHLRHRARSTK
jgi:crotonobetainyl-CoA:carnitine CoA-transferase CaiB-like acyl-CoA transferase